MIGIARLWKAVTGAEGDTRPPEPPSTIPRGLSNLKVPPPDPLWPDDAEPSETRTAQRFVPLRTSTILQTASGRRVSARIINISRTGVAVEADFNDLRRDDVTLVGTRPVTAGRPIALGRVFLFKKPLDPKLCDPSIIL